MRIVLFGEQIPLSGDMRYLFIQILHVGPLHPSPCVCCFRMYLNPSAVLGGFWVRLSVKPIII